ncbi:unnamed protein product (macronuclear) [Paramecium tetraurelia]|uniref:Uncharacterized protein n=1 Tax=Paramecium tetraurelia TaxID=5888 RepID=A0D8P0_PARTE|nr:uncharacterized protein GSPATT00014353001 [Paramecium tetraurelia]CAK79407.1 unnamed protein product [Paramecium tetraurelia]|eukprot:XP_001446804.1 hypothetical protein (macronuclear) [Paramecium tetraurelia strain d4-2]
MDSRLIRPSTPKKPFDPALLRQSAKKPFQLRTQQPKILVIENYYLKT